MREDLAGVGMGENEILVLLAEGALEMSFQLGGDSACQRHRPRAPFRLRGKQVAADVVAPNWILCALQSMSRQRRASSSPWCRPVIAAVRNMAKSVWPNGSASASTAARSASSSS